MKATLTFNLDDPDDKMAHDRCVKALDMAIALHQICSIRKSIEYKIESKKLDGYETLHEILEEINENLIDNGIFIDKLIN